MPDQLNALQVRMSRVNKMSKKWSDKLRRIGYIVSAVLDLLSSDPESSTQLEPALPILPPHSSFSGEDGPSSIQTTTARNTG